MLLIACLLLACGVGSARAQNNVANCISVYNPSSGQYSCQLGWTPILLNGLSTTVTAIKSSLPGLLGTIYCYNANATVAYIQVFDVATAAGVILGTTKPVLSLGIPSALASGAGPASVGIAFQKGIQVAVTNSATGASANGSGMDCSATFN
jgi:hypothetical protein